MSVKHVLFVLLWFLLLCESNSMTERGTDCQTPRRTFGVCKQIQECAIITNVFKTNQLNEETKERIKEYSCESNINGIPKTCCEKDAFPCKTPEQTAGICVPINRCSILANLLDKKPFLSKAVVQYLQSTECPSPDNKARVCCPFVEKHPKLEVRINSTLTKKILPDPGECGIQEADLKVIGGTKVELGEFPWMALLEFGPKEKPILACGGTLISSRFVLTAAHCVQGPSPTRFGGVKRIRLGEYNLRNETDCIWYFDDKDCALPIVRIDVESIVAHESFVFNGLTREHDIAIIKMKSDAETTDFVRPICLPSPKIQIPEQLTVAGWGSTEIRDQSIDKLKVNVPLYDKTDCSNKYEKLLRGLKLGRGQTCAGGVVGKDSCTGDSGGPLMAGIPNKFDRIWYQFGVISFGPTPCGKPHPAVYTLVSEYVPWIINQISKLS